MKTPEGKVKDKVKAMLKQYGAYYLMPVQTGYGKAGVDFHCCYNGRALFIETKAQGYKLTERQGATRREIELAGGAFFIVNDEPESIHRLRIWLEESK